MRLAPGSFLWLVAHDLRLSRLRLRAMFGERGIGTIALVVTGVVIGFHLLAYPVARWALSGEPSRQDNQPGVALAVLFLLPWLISQALTQMTRALYTRGDLDLLLASPVSSRAVVSARSLAVAIETLLSVGLFVFPLANMTALVDGPHWLAVYPALAASALLGTAVGLLLTVGLFVLLGPRRTRLVSQVLSTLIASAFILSAQILNVLPDPWREALSAGFSHPAPGSLFHHDGPLWLPVRAALGDPLALALWVGLCCLAFAAAAIGLGPRFLDSAVRSAGAEGPTRRSAGATTAMRRFRAGAGVALRRKEWRLLLREPYLASQLLLQIIYTLPVSVVVWRSQGAGGSVALAAAPAIVVIAAQISASLAWLAVSSEDAPDFIASAPVTRAEVERRKLESVVLPMALFVLPPILGLAWFEPGAALLALAFAAAAATSTALLNFWHPMPGKRSNVMRRHAQSKIVAVMEHALALCWALAAVLAVLESTTFLLPVAVVAGLLWINRPKGQGGRRLSRA